jgi:hypothetical protein
MIALPAVSEFLPDEIDGLRRILRKPTGSDKIFQGITGGLNLFSKRLGHFLRHE